MLAYHTRKQKADDNFDTISGTNGLLGAADGAFMVYKSKRIDGDATIEVSGRDQPDKHFMLTRNKEILCWDFKGEHSPDYTESLEPVGVFINVDNPTWEGTATELIEKLSLDIKPNVLSLKLNVNTGKLYNLYFIQYSNKRTHKGRKIQFRYDMNYLIMGEPDIETESDDSTEDEFQYQPVKGDLKVGECYIREDSKCKPFHDMTEED